ncbi:MAG TPA: cardiolipin synthase [Bacillales bacterium]|nr:cardiolipin synthase [Bacillales bacterium]
MNKQLRQFVLLAILTGCLYVGLFSHHHSAAKTFAIILYFVVLVSIVFQLLLENRSPYKTLLWIYVLLFLPVIGYLYFIYSGQLQVKGYLFQRKRENNETYLRNAFNNKQNPLWENMTGEEQRISNMIVKKSNFPISFFTETKVLRNGDETFPAILEALKNARRYIYLEYYIFRDDDIGTEIVRVLEEKARQGLDVRLIYDAVGSVGLSMRTIKKMEAAGVQVACFSPIKSGFFNQKINFRNHRKIIVVDGKAGFVGGLNIGDEYLGRDKRMGFWRDTHLLVKGEAVRSLHAIFIIDWAYLSHETVTPEQTERTFPMGKSDGGVQVAASGPDSNEGLMTNLYFSMITSARQSVWIATPYFIPNKAIRSALAMAAARGVSVKLMVPETNDGFLTKYATRSYFDELLDNGIEVYMYRKGFMHQKIMIVDGRYASIGTANVDFRSLNLNFEVNVFLFNCSSVKELINNYKTDIAESVQVDLERYRNRRLTVRAKESVARLFSPAL